MRPGAADGTAQRSAEQQEPAFIACAADAIVKFLHFNGAYKDEAASAEVFKVLVIDAHTLNIVATLLHTEALRQHGVTLVLSIDKEREAITDAPVVYFVRATPENANAIVSDLEHGLYREVRFSCAGCCVVIGQ
jgi:Sec1 family